MEQMAEGEFEQIVHLQDRASGLRAIVAIHSTVLGPRVGVLLAHGVNSSRVQPQLFATPDRQPIEVKPTRPIFIPFKRVPLSIVAVVPHIVDRAALLVQHAMQGFHSIAVN